MLVTPFIEQEQLYGQDEDYNWAGESSLDFIHSGEDILFENQVTQTNANGFTIENIIELFLKGSVNGISFSTDVSAKNAETMMLIKTFHSKLLIKINDPAHKQTFIKFVNSFTTASPGWKIYLIVLITYIFNFKARIVTHATSEYTNWLTTKTNGIWAIKEYDAGALPFLTKYWNATPTPKTTIVPREPWSAAFISWVIKEAGAWDLFEYSGGHYTYIRQAKLNRNGNTQNPFWLYTITEIINRMQPGDMLCKSRGGSGLTFENILGHHDSTSAHVDIITEIDMVNKKIRVVGGNVCDNVDHKLLTIGTNKITNSDGEEYFAGIGVGIA